MPTKKAAEEAAEEAAAEKRRESSLKLAHLTATLKLAGIIPYPLNEDDDPAEFDVRNSPGSLILAATKFLATCEGVQSVLNRAEELRAEQIVSKEKLKEFISRSSTSRISIDEVIKVAGVDRLTLTKAELKKLRIDKEWKSLSPAEKARSVFLCLSGLEFRSETYEETLVPDEVTGSLISIPNFFANIVPPDVLTQFRRAFYKRNEKRQQMGLETMTCWWRLVDRLTNRACRRLAKTGVDWLIMSQPGLITALQRAKVKRESKNASERAKLSLESRRKKDSDNPSQAKSGGSKINRKPIRKDGQFSERPRDTQKRFKANKTNSRYAEAPSSPLLLPQRKGIVAS